MKTVLMLVMMAFLVAGCTHSQPAHPRKTVAVFPDLPSIDRTVYEQIKKTCGERWQLGNMKMDTFSVTPVRGEYVVKCDGMVEGELYRCVIRVNSGGEWINDGRAKKTP